MNKEELIDKIFTSEEVDMQNLMGCNESWYDPYYAVKETFSKEELNEMNVKEINDLLKLAENMGEAFY